MAHNRREFIQNLIMGCFGFLFGIIPFRKRKSRVEPKYSDFAKGGIVSLEMINSLHIRDGIYYPSRIIDLKDFDHADVLTWKREIDGSISVQVQKLPRHVKARMAREGKLFVSFGERIQND